MDFLGPVMQIILFFWGPLSQQFGYLKNLNDNIATLETETEQLKFKHDEVQADVEDAVSVGKSGVPQADRWLVDVSNLVTDVESIKVEFSESRTCLNGCCINQFSRYRLGKKVVKRLKDVGKLKENGAFGRVALEPRRRRVLQMQTSLPLTKQNTSEQALEEIWTCLHDDDNAIICIYGMGGVGKTTLMKEINNRLIGITDFAAVIWVTMSKDLNLEFIQQKIGNQLDLNFDSNESIEEKMHKLFARLKNIRYMLILDGLWTAFSLSQIGIPKPDKQNRCKIAITTRSIRVCNDMEADKKIKVSTLTPEESWSLFHDKAGDVVLLPEIRPLAEEVVKECSGLPLAVKTVGRAMREKNKKELWRNALRALKASAPEIPGVEREVFLPLKHSYDCLDEPRIQSCFLYCSLYPEDWEIPTEDLVRYWAFEEGLICSVNTLEDALNKGYEIIDRLKDACLLEEGLRSTQHVRMHDLLRDLGIWMNFSLSSSSIKASKFLVKAGQGLVHPPEEKLWEGAERISLMQNHIRNLQIKPNCTNLVSLFLCNNNSLGNIHDGFFLLMPKLQILDLRRTSIKSLPASLSLLVNLRALIFEGCSVLVEMPPLGDLKELQLLDLSGTGIKNLPEDIAGLVNLRLLDLNYTSNLTTIPHNAISRLTSLEDLRLSGCFHGIATLREAATSRSLTSFAICLSDLHGFTADDVCHQFWSDLRRFKVCIGTGKSPSNMIDDKIVDILGCRSFPSGIEGFMGHAERLNLSDCQGIEHLTQISGCSKNLRSIHVNSFRGLKRIIDWREVGDDALDCLELLELLKLPDLEVFDVGEPLPPARFQRLRKIYIDDCHSLKCVFSSSMVEHLHQLREITIICCYEIEEMVQGVLPDNALQRLSFLHLKRLPKLKSVCPGQPALASLETIYVQVCPELRKLPSLCFGRKGIRGKVEGMREWWEGVEWEDNHSKALYSTIYKEVQSYF